MLVFGLVEGASVLGYLGVMLRAPLLPVIGAPMMLASMLLLLERLRTSQAGAQKPWPAGATAS